MAPFTKAVFNQLRNLSWQPSGNQPADSDRPRPQGRTLNDLAYRPSPIDIVVVRVMLSRSKRLPPDLVDAIFDHAGYWASTTASVGKGQVSGGGESENKFLLRTLPIGLTSAHGGEIRQYEKPASRKRLNEAQEPEYFARLADYPTPRLVNPVRKIVFRMTAHEMPHLAEPTYKDSWAWFDAGLERFEKDTESESPALQYSSLRPIQPTLDTSLDYYTNWRPRSDSGADSDENESSGFSDDAEDEEQPQPAQEQTDAAGPEPKPPRERLIYKHELLPGSSWLVQKNMKGQKWPQDHVVTWSWTDDVAAESKDGQALEDGGRGRATANGEFVRNLKMGDVVTLWAKARFGGWSNVYEFASVTVYWAV